MLTFCELKDEREFFDRNWSKMVDDIQHQLTQTYYPIKYVPNEIELQNLLLQELEQIFCRNGQNINNYNLPYKSLCSGVEIHNQLIQEELCYIVQHLEE